MPEADVDHIYDYPKGYIEDILKSVKTIAMVGACLLYTSDAADE